MRLFYFQVGLIGLVEQEWIDTLATVDPEDIIFLDFVETGNQLAAELREEVGGSLKVEKYFTHGHT